MNEAVKEVVEHLKSLGLKNISNHQEFEEKLENIEKSIGLLINSNILKDFKNKSYHIIYSLDNEWFHMVVKGHEICCKNS